MQISSFSALASTARSTVKALAAAVAEPETDAAKDGVEQQSGTYVTLADKAAKARAARTVTEVKAEAQPAAEASAAPKKGTRKGTVLDAYA